MVKIVCIYPYDESTTFLDPIVELLQKQLDNAFLCLNIPGNDKEHESAIEQIKITAAQSIIFLGHGTDGCLQGASHGNYMKRDFINKNNIHIFKDKNVFCLSCNSNNRLGKFAKENECNVFLGFGNIPTDWISDGYDMPSEESIVMFFRSAINYIIIKTLELAIVNNYNFKQIERLIKIITNKYIIDEVMPMKKYYELKDIKWLVSSFFLFKEEMKLFGNGEKIFI